MYINAGFGMYLRSPLLSSLPLSPLGVHECVHAHVYPYALKCALCQTDAPCLPAMSPLRVACIGLASPRGSLRRHKPRKERRTNGFEYVNADRRNGEYVVNDATGVIIAKRESVIIIFSFARGAS